MHRALSIALQSSILFTLVLTTTVTAVESPKAPATEPATRPARTAQAYFVDEETGEETIRPATDLPPLAGKSGKPTIVRSIKATTDGGKTVKILFLEKYTADAKERLSAMKPDDPKLAESKTKGLLVRSPAPGSPWVPADSPQGQQITDMSKPGLKQVSP